MIGVVSDTHGLLRPQIVEVLRGSELIIHAGDIGNLDVIRTLQNLAPVMAVRGNNDHGPWADGIPLTNLVQYHDHFFYVLHELDLLDLDPVAAEFSAVIYGHSHRPLSETRRGVLYLNPGSAGPRRFTLPISVARIHLTDAGLAPEIITIKS